MLTRGAKIRIRDENQGADDPALRRPIKRAKLTVPSDGAAKKRAALGDLSNTATALTAVYGTTAAKKAELGIKTTAPSAKVITISDKENATSKANGATSKSAAAAAGTDKALRSTAARTAAVRSTATNALKPAKAAASSTTMTTNSRIVLKAKRTTAAASAALVSAKSSAAAGQSRLAVDSKKTQQLEASRDEMEVVLDKSKEEMSEADSDEEAPASGSAANKTVIHRTVKAAQPEEDEEETAEGAVPSRQPRLSTTHLLSNIFAGVDLEEIEDIDANDRDDPLQCVHLVEDIFAVMREREAKDRPSANYMAHQQSISAKMRGILTDWMIDVGSTFTLLSETVFLAVRLMDMFLSKKQVSRERMQLVGVAALVIASKFEEVRSPIIEDWIWISDEAFTRDQILRMETIMLGVLNYNVGTPTPLHFLRRFSKVLTASLPGHPARVSRCVPWLFAGRRPSRTR